MSSEDFKKRVGLAIGTANPNNEDIQNTATGLGGLILRGDLYNKALAGANNNSFQDFDSFVVTDPNLVDPGIDVSGLRTTTDVSPYLLGGIPDYEGIRYEAYNPNRLTDLMRLYSSGLPTLDTPQAAAPDFTGGEMIDTGDGGQATTIQPIDTGGNTDFEQNLIDEGIGVQLEPGAPVVAPGEIPVTQQEMDDFNAIPVNREYGQPMNIGYGEGQVDPSLAAAVGGVDTTPLGGSNLVTTSSGDVFAADDPRLLEQTDFQEPQYRIRDQLNEDFLQGGILKDVGSAFEGIKDQGIDGLNALREKLTSLGGKLKPGFDNVIEIGGKTIDLTKSLIGGVLSLASGIPGIGLLLNAESASGAQQGLVADQFKDEGVTLDDIGRIKQVGLDYDTPENVMAGYSPGETGIRIGNISLGGGVIQESIVDRLSTLEKTKNEKYGGSFYNADGTPKNNPDTGEPTKLGQREEALKENLNTVARAAGAVTLDGPQYTTNPNAEGYAPFSDTLQAGTTTYATDYFPELGQEESAPNIITPLAKPDVAEDVIQEVNTIAGNNIFVNTVTGEVYPDEVLAREDLETSTLPDQPPGGGDANMFYETPTPDNIIANTGDAFDYFNDVDISQDAPTTFVDDFEVSGDAAPITGDSGADSFFDAVDNAAVEAAAAQPISNVQAAANQDSYRGGGGGGGDGPAPSAPISAPGDSYESAAYDAPKPAAPVYQDAIMRGQTGGGNDRSSGGKIVCTMMNNSYGFGSFRNKIWMKFHKDLSPEYQKGYHKLFLPLVRIAKTNKVIKKVLEHIAVHSTIDMRQATRGKTHLLGRVYRKILEPICYIVGKNAK